MDAITTQDGEYTVTTWPDGTSVRTLAAFVPPPAPSPRLIARVSFLLRFTNSEAVAIDLASIGATEAAATVRRHINLTNASTKIDLDLAETRAGVQALEAAGLLAAGRAAEILDSPVREAELP